MELSGVPSVGADEVAQFAEGTPVLDVREDDEWAAGHLPGAVHIPLGELPARLAEVDSDDTVYVVCRSGGRSARATAWLVQNGVDAVNVDGGMKQVESSGARIVADSGRPTII